VYPRQVFIESLASHPDLEISALVDVAVGKRYADATKWRLGTDTPPGVGDMKICTHNSLSTKDIDLVFSALPGGVGGPIELDLANKEFSSSARPAITDSRSMFHYSSLR